MISPNKYLNLDSSIIRVASLIIKELLKEEVVMYDELMSKVYNAIGKDSKIVFIPSLNFLFCLGKIEYLERLDSFSLVK